MFKGDTKENPMLLGAQDAFDDTMSDIRCPTCKVVLKSDSNKNAGEQLSASGKFCEDCILANCDTTKNRHTFLTERNLYVRFLKWATGRYWMKRLDEQSSTYDEFTHKDAMYIFMDGKYDYDYFTWLMGTN